MQSAFTDLSVVSGAAKVAPPDGAQSAGTRYLLRLRSMAPPASDSSRRLNSGGRQFVDAMPPGWNASFSGSSQPRKPAVWKIGTEILCAATRRIEAGTNGEAETVRCSGESVRVPDPAADLRPPSKAIFATGCPGIAAARVGAGRPARIDRASHHGAQPEIALGLLFTARHDFPELAAYSSTRFRKRLHLSARMDAFEGK